MGILRPKFYGILGRKNIAYVLFLMYNKSCFQLLRKQIGKVVDLTRIRKLR